MNKLLFIILILASLFADKLPSQSNIIKMTHEEKMNLYERNKINRIEAFFNRDVGMSSERVSKIGYTGMAITYTPYIIFLITNTSNQEIIHMTMLTNYITIGLVIKEIQKQRKLFNEKLYKEIFLIKPL